MLRMHCIAASIAFAPAAHATSTEQMEANKKAAAEFTRERFATLRRHSTTRSAVARPLSSTTRPRGRSNS